jgi:hypothetical protein
MTRQRLTQSHLVKTILYFHFLMINTYPFLIKKWMVCYIVYTPLMYEKTTSKS